MDDLVPIGRFAATSRLSVTALRHYHDLGLLVPALVDDATGYRYYRLGQANRAEAIRTLRSLDVPLDEVATVLDGDADRADQVLRHHQQRLSEALARHERMLGYVRRLVSGEEQLMPYDIDTADLPTQHVASVRRTTDLEHVGEVIGEAFATAAAAVTAADVPITGAPFVRYHDLVDEDTDGDIEVCLPVPGTDVDLGDAVAVTTLPATATVRTVHRGPYDQVGPAYHALFAWIHEHDRDPVGPPRETYLNDPQEVPVEEQLTQVDIPVAPA